MKQTYVVGYDGSDPARRALEFAIDGAKANGAVVWIAYVLEWSPYSFLTPEELEERHKRRAEELERAESAVIEPVVAAVASDGVELKHVIRYGHVAETLCAIAEEQSATQMFVGRTGESGLISRFFGSVASSLAQTAPVPCTLVP